jgi:hypothetical protein
MVIYEWKDVEYLGKIASEVDDTLPVSPLLALASVLIHLSLNTWRKYTFAPANRPAVASATRASWASSSSIYRRASPSTTLPSTPPRSSSPTLPVVLTRQPYWKTCRLQGRTGAASGTTLQAILCCLRRAMGMLPHGSGHQQSSELAKREQIGRFIGEHHQFTTMPVLVVPSSTRNRSTIMCTELDITASVRCHYCGFLTSADDLLLAVVPVTVLSNTTSDNTNVPFHPSYSGTIVFQNVFKGQLPATDYPKVNVSDALDLSSFQGADGSLVLPRHVPRICHARRCLGLVVL